MKKKLIIIISILVLIIAVATIFLIKGDEPEPYDLLTSQTRYVESDLEYHEETSKTNDGIIIEVAIDRISTSQPLYIEDLINKSSYVVKGKIVSIDYEFRNRYDYKKYNRLAFGDEKKDLLQWMIYTVYTVEVEDSLRGDTKKTITVTRIGNTGDFQFDKQKAAAERCGFAKIHGGTFILPERYIKVDVGEEYTILIKEKLDDGAYLLVYKGVFPEDSKNGINVDSLLKAE